MIYIVENALPILLATLAGLVVGVAFYPAARQRAGWLIPAFIAEAWFAAILAGALILAPAKADPWVMAIGTAVVIWFGFVVPVLVVTLRAYTVTVREIFRSVAHWLIVMVVEAVVLHAVGLTAPAP
jgi:hypothetical protein